jgi:four helix bundle protein
MDETSQEFASWAASLDARVRGDPLWRLTAFRIASYALHLAWADATALGRVRVAEPVAAQLYRAVGSVAANIAEGYSRSSGRDRARLYEYALGSARESIVWYRAAEPVLGFASSAERQALHQGIVRLLLAMIPHERQRSLP